MNAEKSNIPKEFQKGSNYLKGTDIEFKEDFFKLLKPNSYKTKIGTSGKSSYYSPSQKLVYIKDDYRKKNSVWNRESVIYHEFGHVIDSQRNLSIKSSQWIGKMKTNVHKPSGKTELHTRFNPIAKKSEIYQRNISIIKDADTRLNDYLEEISAKSSTFKKGGFSKADIIEQIGATRDAIMSLNPTYGYGHSKVYFSKKGNRNAEFLAHAFENAYVGNPVFKKFLPDLYSEMIVFIKKLKPIN